MLRSEIGKSGYKNADYTDEYLVMVISAMKERVSFVKEYLTKSPYFFSAPDQYDEKVIQKRWKEDSVDLLKKLSDRIKSLSNQSKEDYEIALNDTASESGAGIGKIIHPLRLAVSGMGEGPGVFDILFVIGKEETLRRINTAIQKIKIN